MERRLDALFREWHRLGGAVLVDEVDTESPVRSPEEVIAESTLYCRQSGRLMWVVLGWLVRHVDEVDVHRLLAEARRQGDLSVLGVLCDAAYLRNPHPKFRQVSAACVPNQKVELFFHRVAKSPLAARLAEENALDVFRRWNYLCNELRYL